jgi:hypothetical protein
MSIMNGYKVRVEIMDYDSMQIMKAIREEFFKKGLLKPYDDKDVVLLQYIKEVFKRVK